MANIIPVNNEQCKKLKVSKQRTLAHIANQHIISINVHEYRQASTSFPIVLVKKPNSSNYRSIAMLGFEAGNNLYLDGKEWKAAYIPQGVSMVPFSLGLDPEKENTLTTCIDIDSELVGENHENALFDALGNETDYLKQTQESLGKLYDNEVLTESFIEELISNDLLVELELIMSFSNGENKKLLGLFGIDNKKFFQLPESKLLDFYKRGLFSPIYAMLNSLGQAQRLAQLHNTENLNNTITNIQFVEADHKP